MYSTTFYDGADKICEVKHEENTFKDILSKLTGNEYTKVVEAFVDYYNFGVDSSDEELEIEEIENAEMLAEMIEDLNYADGDFYVTVKLDDDEIESQPPKYEKTVKTENRVKFFNPKSKEVFADVEDSDDWEDILKRLTEDELTQLKRWFVFLVCLTDDDETEPWLDRDELDNINTFGSYLIEYYEAFNEKLFEFYEKTTEKDVKCITIRDLYKIGKENGILDKPISWNYDCKDDWYAVDNATLLESSIDHDENGIILNL